jgi:hypothetical protein
MDIRTTHDLFELLIECSINGSDPTDETFPYYGMFRGAVTLDDLDYIFKWMNKNPNDGLSLDMLEGIQAVIDGHLNDGFTNVEFQEREMYFNK